MKNKITLSIALVLSIAFLSLLSTTNAHAQFMFPVAETGLVLIEPGEVLVLTVQPKRSQTIEILSCQFGRGAGPGGGPHVKIACDERRVSVGQDEAYSFEFRGSDALGGFTVEAKSSRLFQSVVQAHVHRIVTGPGGQQRKEYVGHVTLIKQ